MQIYHISTPKGLKLQKNEACAITSISFFQILHSNQSSLKINLVGSDPPTLYMLDKHASHITERVFSFLFYLNSFLINKYECV